ncbi:MAG: signal transduction histidine kinase [Bacteroidetes bacterium OLB9]|nr:MAG: signal transduction histidine kinase [Bacteroidetes bacterium OLB9]MCZ2337394.1 histidine kinase [Chitinophagales bacterium]
MDDLTEVIKYKLGSHSPKNKMYHYAFWAVLFLILLLTNVSDASLPHTIIVVSISVLFYAIIAYFNYFYLFPKYLKDRNFIWHIAALLLASLVLTPIKTVLLFWSATGSEDLQNNYISNQWDAFFTMFIAGIVMTLYLITNDWLVQQRNKIDLESQTLQSELKFLKSQINPHFLFNTLNSLYALTLKKSDLAPEIVLKLSEMMRYMLYECNEKEVLLSKEINYMENYLELEKLRYGNKMLINLDIHGEINGQTIAPLLLIPFIENAFKHGLNNQVSQGFVNLSMDVDRDHLIMNIENSKAPSLPKTSGVKSGGIGLINVKRRMDILYPERYFLDIKESPNTYHIELQLDLKNN